MTKTLIVIPLITGVFTITGVVAWSEWRSHWVTFRSIGIKVNDKEYNGSQTHDNIYDQKEIW